MNEEAPAAAAQRLFQKGPHYYILINKAGDLVFFTRRENGRLQVMERQEDVDFKETGSMLIQEGWCCVGPGTEYSHLLAKDEDV